MACFHPLHAFPVGITDSGRTKYFIDSGDKKFIYHPEDKKLPLVFARKITDFIEVPCGKCIGCRLDYSRSWATRCMLEASQYKFNYFLTLTYDDEHLKFCPGVDEDGVLCDVPTLVPKDLQDFLKRLRIEYKRKFDYEGLRFYGCGEYGDEKKRPHYHVLMFNMPIHDIEYWYTNPSTHQKMYVSKFLSEIWGKGIVAVGEVSWESCAYVARYVVKKRKGPDASEFYSKRGIVPEFVRMSRRPGIASDYYDKHFEDIYNCDEILVKKGDKVLKAKPSRYFDKKFDIDNHEVLVKIKEIRRSCAENSLNDKLSRTTLSKAEYLALCEDNKICSMKKLKRSLHFL